MEAIALNTAAAAATSRFARFWQAVRREAKRALVLHVEASGMMTELYRRSGH